MGFDISKITNAALKKLAEEFDRKDAGTQGIMENEEFNVFSNDARVKTLIESDTDANTVFSTIKATFEGDTIAVSNPISSNKDMKRGDKNFFKEQAAKYAKQEVSTKGLVAKLEGFAGTNPSDKAILDDIKLIYNKMNALTYNDVTDIDKNHKEIKKYLKNIKPEDKWNGFTKDILEQFEKVKEKEIIAKKAQGMINTFEEKINDADQAGAKEYDFDSYLDAIHDDKKAKGWRKDGTKAAYKQTRAYAKKLSESLHDDAAIAKYQGNGEIVTEDTSFKKTKLNKHHQEILDRKSTADRRAVDLKSVTYAEMEEKLSKDLARKLRGYAEQHPGEKAGTFDLSGLRKDEIFGANLYTGSDATVTTHSDYPLSERGAIKDGIGLVVNGDRALFTEKETKKLIDFLGFENDKKSHNLGEAIKDNIPGIISGVVAGLSFVVRQNQSVTIKGLSAELANELATQLQTTATQNGSTFSIKITQKQITSGFALGTALAPVAVNILVQTIMGKEKDETTCFNVQEASYYKSLDALKKFVHAKYPNKEEAVMTLARHYVEQYGDEEQGLNKFYDFLNKDKGINSTMSPDECFATFKASLPEEKPAAPTVVVKGHCEEAHQEPTPVNHPEIKGVPWQTVAARYDCLDEDLSKLTGIKNKDALQAYKTKLVKTMQSVTNDDYTLDNLVELTNVARTVRAHKKISLMTAAEKTELANKIRAAFAEYAEGENIGFDVENYIANFFSNTIGKQKVPTIKLSDGTTCEYNSQIVYNPTMRRANKSTGTSGHTGDTGVCTIGAKQSATVTSSDGKINKTVTTQADLNNAVANARQAGYTVDRKNSDPGCFDIQ